MNEITRTVYSIYWPETRAVVQHLWEQCNHRWYQRNYTKHQDGMHQPLMRDWPQWAGVELGEAFPHSYPCNGASEAINNLIIPDRGAIHVFEGEYEGYAAIARARKIPVVTHPRDLNAVAQMQPGPNDHFWLSQPSSIDGNIWADFEAFLELMRRHHPHVKVHVDLTYVGATTRPVVIEPKRHFNVATVVFSLSKPFGAYYHRIGGCYSRQPIDSLWGNAWFKNLFSVTLGHALLLDQGRFNLPLKYESAQRAALDAAVSRGMVPAGAMPSDVVLLAHSPSGPVDMRRAEGAYRYCLSPIMDETINAEFNGTEDT